MTEEQHPQEQAYVLPDIPQHIQDLVNEYKAEVLKPWEWDQKDIGVSGLDEWSASNGASWYYMDRPIGSIYEGKEYRWHTFNGRGMNPGEIAIFVSWREPDLVTYGPQAFESGFAFGYAGRPKLTVRPVVTLDYYIHPENGWHPVGIDELMLDSMMGESGRYSDEDRSEMMAALDALTDIVYHAPKPEELFSVHCRFSEWLDKAQKRQKRPYYKPRMKDSRVEMTHTKAETRLFRISRKPEMNITAEEFDGRPISLGMGKLNTVTQIRVTDETMDLAELEDKAGKPLLSFTDLYWLNWWESVVRDNPESRVMYGADLMAKAGYSNPRKASQDDVRREVLDVATHLTGIYGAIDAEGENRAYGDRRTVRSIKRRRFAEFSIDVEQYDDGTWDFKLTRQDIGQETPFPLLEYAEDKGEAFQIPSWVFKFPIKLSSKVRKALFYILRQALIKGVSDTIDLATMLRAFGWEDMDKYAKHRLLAGIEKGLDYWKKKCSPKVIHSWNWEYEGRRTVAVAVHANHRLLEQNQKLEKAESARRSAPLLPDPDEGGEDRG